MSDRETKFTDFISPKNREILVQRIIPFSLSAVCFIWRYVHLFDRDICLDEPFTIFHAQQSIGEIIMLTVHGEPTPPLFMLIVHFGMKLFGMTPLLRIIPLVFGSVTLFFLYKTACRLSNVFGAILTSMLYLFSSWHFFFSIEVRTYSLLSMLAAISYYQCICLIQKKHGKWLWAAMVFNNFAIVSTHYFGWFILFNQLLILLFYRSDRDLRIYVIKQLSTTILLSSSLFFLVIKQFLISSKVTWVPPPTSGLYMHFMDLMLNDRTLFYIYMVLGFGLLFYMVKMFLSRQYVVGQFKESFLMLVFFVVPYFSMYFASYKVSMFLDRYILFNSIPLYLFIGVVLMKLFERTWYLQLVSVIVISISAFENLQINSKNYYYREVKNAVDFTRKFKTPDSKVLLNPRWLDHEYAYYFNPKIFENTTGFYDALARENIIPVWGLKDVPKILNDSGKTNRAIVYQYDNPEESLIIDTSIFKLTEHVLFPQCNEVRVYDRIRKTEHGE